MTASVHRLHLANVNLSGKYNPPTYQNTRIAVYAYLVITGTEVILVDTGVAAGTPLIEKRFEPHIRPVERELARFGLTVEEVDVIVNSHLHFDHCGNNRLFPRAEVFIQQAELEVARTTPYTIREWFDYDRVRIHPVAGDAKITTDVELIASPGHTPGHQSVLAKTDVGSVLVAAQAAFTADEYRRGGDPAEQAHEGLGPRYVESIERLKSVSAERVFFSHDTETATDARQPRA